MNVREILTPTEYAKIAGRSRSWVEERCKDGRLPAIRDGGRWILRRADLIQTGWLTPSCGHTIDPVPAGAPEVR
jgi:excisionase family DNA binding protein